MFPLKDNVPTDRVPVVTLVLIAVNVIVFFVVQDAQLSLGGADVDDGRVVELGAIPYEFSHRGEGCDVAGQSIVCGASAGPQPAFYLTAITSMFLHGGLLHIIGNMLFLWIFGNNVEDAMGRVRFVAFYLLGGLAALALQFAVDPNSQVPTIGASGAVAGVLGGYILLHPRARVLTIVFIVFFFTLIELPALVMLGLWFVQQVVLGALDSANPTGGGGGVAYFAHVGGFVFGLALIRAFARGRGERPAPRLGV